MAVGTGSNLNRQRMINLMYIVFIAMMALNVSPEVLDGFSKVEGELRQATAASEARNRRLASDMQASFSTNPAKASMYYEQSQELQRRTDSLYQHLQQLKEAIAIEADGRGEPGRSVQVCGGAELSGALRGMPPVPEDEAVVVGAQRGVRQAVGLRSQPPAPAARAVYAHVPYTPSDPIRSDHQSITCKSMQNKATW